MLTSVRARQAEMSEKAVMMFFIILVTIGAFASLGGQIAAAVSQVAGAI